MREILYLSERKLHGMFLDAGRLSWLRPKAVDATIGAPGASAKATFDVAGGPDTAAKLEKVIDHLRRTDRIADLTTTGLKPNQWLAFDLDMTYGTGHEDTAPPGADDIVLFGGRLPDAGNGSRRTELLLCGSVGHLRDRIASSGRLGSSTEWLYDVIKELDKRERRGTLVIPEFITSIVSRKRSSLPLEEVVHYVFGALMESTYPRPDRGRLTGLARVLWDIDDPKWATRMVLATPLYVEIPPPAKMRSRWRRALRKLHRSRD